MPVAYINIFRNSGMVSQVIVECESFVPYVSDSNKFCIAEGWKVRNKCFLFLTGFLMFISFTALVAAFVFMSNKIYLHTFWDILGNYQNLKQIRYFLLLGTS